MTEVERLQFELEQERRSNDEYRKDLDNLKTSVKHLWSVGLLEQPNDWYSLDCYRYVSETIEKLAAENKSLRNEIALGRQMGTIGSKR